jgi:hypothetical protein
MQENCRLGSQSHLEQDKVRHSSRVFYPGFQRLLHDAGDLELQRVYILASYVNAVLIGAISAIFGSALLELCGG